MTTTNDAPDTPADSKTEVNENPGEKTLGFSSMNEPATEPTEPKADAKAETDKPRRPTPNRKKMNRPSRTIRM